jgi:hypothetical protein
MYSGFVSRVIATRAGRIALVAFAWLITREASIRTSGFEDGPVLCPWRLITGYPCPGCGGIRAMGAICAGQFEQAWLLNPVAFLVSGVVLVWAFGITPIIKFAQQAAIHFRSQAFAIQTMTLTVLYALVWIAAIARFNSGIL